MVENFSIGFFGDLTTGENYQIKSEINERINVLRQYGYDWLFEKVDCLLTRFDMNVANLETPLTCAVKSPLLHKKTVLHWADPVIVPKILEKHKINAVSLGNNHCMDYDTKGLTDTIEALKNFGISSFGAGLNIDSASLPLVKNLLLKNKKINIYIIGGYKYRTNYDEDFKFYAAENKSGVFLLTDKTADAVIKSIKTSDKDAYIVMFPHFGFDLLKTTQLQIDYAHSFIDSGADLVIGHGPHMINSVEKYKDKIILYGIGNFIFPANFSGKTLPYNMAAELEFSSAEDERNPKIRVYPTYMDNQSSKPQTRPIKDSELGSFLNLLLEGAEDLRKSINIDVVDGLIRIGL